MLNLQKTTPAPAAGSPQRTFGQTVGDLCRARFPYLYVQTWEEERVVEEIGRVAASPDLIRTPRQVHVWSITSGLAPLGGRGGPDSQAALKALDRIEKAAEPSLFILRDFHVFFGTQGRPGDPQVIRKLRDMIPALQRGPGPKNVVFVSPVVELPVELQKDVTIVEFDLPSEAELRAALQSFIDTNRQAGHLDEPLDPDTEERLTKAALGLTMQEAENAFAHAMVRHGHLDASVVDTIVEEKRQIIRKTEILEFIRPEASFDEVGGLENLKGWLVKRNDSWRDSARRYGLPAPKGILITGVPGCGKSLSARCVSQLWQLPLLRLDVGRIFSGIVGSSEQNMRTALRTAEAISPSILWIDEIEKGFGGSTGPGGDSGTSQRVFGSFLTWMQEKQKPVFVCATSNAIASLPPEFLRKGRFDEIFFVDLPTRTERVAIWRVHLGRRLFDEEIRGDVSPDDPRLLEELADVSEGYSGAEIEQAVLGGLFDAYAERRPVRATDFSRAVKNMVPLSVTQAEEVRATREWAQVRAVPASNDVIPDPRNEEFDL